MYNADDDRQGGQRDYFKCFPSNFFIRYGQSTGTAFTIDHEDKQYLVTAHHVLPDIADGSTIQVHRHGQWVDWPVKVVGSGNPNNLEEDVIVLALEGQVSPSYSMPATSGGLTWAQDVYFLGFPYGLYTANINNDGYPLAIVKRALMSGSTGQLETFLLDGHNNPGFSGGPAVFRPVGSPNGEFHAFGIISAYRTQDIPITFQGQPTGLSSPANTGSVVCPAIKRATDLIELNPIGPALTY